jgi:glycosyltransferase involved in cell wall biosynthesis
MLAKMLREDFGHDTSIIFADGPLHDWITDGVYVRWYANRMPIADVYVTYANAPNEDLLNQLPGKKVLLLLNAREHLPNEWKRGWETDSLKLPFDGVMTTSDWLVERAKEAGQTNVYKIGVGIEPTFKPPKRPASARSIGILIREGNVKGSDFVAEALKLVQKLALLSTLNVISYSDCKIEGPNLHYMRPTREMIPAIYRQCGVWLVGSSIEGFGMPGLEAMASGCALVTADTKGCHEYVKHHHNGLIVESVEEMALSIAALNRDDSLREKLVANALKTAEKFTWTPVIQRTDAFLRSICSQ